jgi:uncharacterized protein YjbJ (UPF0337 family)
MYMDSEELKGKVDQGAGKAKEAWGNITDDPKKKAEGQNQQVEGQVRKGVGKARDTARNAADRVDDAARRAGDALDS